MQYHRRRYAATTGKTKSTMSIVKILSERMLRRWSIEEILTHISFGRVRGMVAGC
jgi:hypothetical protein